MVKLGVITFPFFSHVQSHLCIALELQRRGHEVVIFGTPESLAILGECGVPTRVFSSGQPGEGFSAENIKQLASMSALAGLRHTIAMFTHENKILMEHALPVVRAERVDLLIGDQTVRAHALLAAHLGVPFVAVCSAGLIVPDPVAPLVLSHRTYSDSFLGRAITAFENHVFAFLIYPMSCDFRRCMKQLSLPQLTPLEEYISSSLYRAILAPMTPSLSFPRARHIPQLHYIGRWTTRDGKEPLIQDVPFPYNRLDPSKKLVYISLGTVLGNMVSLLHTILEACTKIPDVQPVLSLGHLEKDAEDDTQLHSLEEVGKASDAILVQFAPQTEIVKRASAVISHGGMCTAMMTASFGVPQIIIPITNDQPGVAARLEYSGTGIRLSISSVSVERVSEALQKLLADEKMKNRALEVGKEFEEAGGVVKAADVVEKILSSPEPAESKRKLWITEFEQ